MKKLNSTNFPTLKQWITDRYDDPYAPAPVTYRATGRPKKDTPTIEFAEAPRINILATSSEDWFFSNVMQADSTGGWIPRWMLNKLPHTDRCIPIPETPDLRKAVALIQRLKEIDSIGVSSIGIKDVDFSLVGGKYENWYRDTKSRFDAQPNPSLSIPYFNHHRSHVLKLAAIYAAASTSDVTVTENAWASAVRRARGLEETIFKFLPTGMNEGGYERSKMLRRIEDEKDEGRTLSNFTRAFQHVETWQRQNHLVTLVSSEQVVLFNRKMSGRPGLVLVADTHRTSYEKKHPSDTIAPNGKEMSTAQPAFLHTFLPYFTVGCEE